MKFTTKKTVKRASQKRFAFDVAGAIVKCKIVKQKGRLNVFAFPSKLHVKLLCCVVFKLSVIENSWGFAERSSICKHNNTNGQHSKAIPLNSDRKQA